MLSQEKLFILHTFTSLSGSIGSVVVLFSVNRINPLSRLFSDDEVSGEVLSASVGFIAAA